MEPWERESEGPAAGGGQDLGTKVISKGKGEANILSSAPTFLSFSIFFFFRPLLGIWNSRARNQI